MTTSAGCRGCRVSPSAGWPCSDLGTGGDPAGAQVGPLARSRAHRRPGRERARIDGPQLGCPHPGISADADAAARHHGRGPVGHPPKTTRPDPPGRALSSPASGVDRVLVTCGDDNIASIAVIEACGGRLDSVIETAQSMGGLNVFVRRIPGGTDALTAARHHARAVHDHYSERLPRGVALGHANTAARGTPLGRLAGSLRSHRSAYRPRVPAQARGRLSSPASGRGCEVEQMRIEQACLGSDLLSGFNVRHARPNLRRGVPARRPA